MRGSKCVHLKQSLDLYPGQSGGFVFGEVEDGVEADHFEEHHDAFAGGIKSALAAGAFDGGEGANERADAGAVELGDAGKIDGEAGGARVDELLELVAVGFFRVSEFKRPLEIQDGGGAGFADADVHFDFFLPRITSVIPETRPKLSEL
jgi:hypothetical protein